MCGCVRAPLLGADVRRTSSHFHFLQKTYFLVIKKKIKKLEIFCCAGARAGAKNGVRVREPHIIAAH